MNSSGKRVAIAFAICLVMLLSPAQAVLPQAEGGEVTGRLLAGDGKPVAGTTVYLHRAAPDTPVIVTLAGQTGNNASLVREYEIETNPTVIKTGADGEFRFADVDAGMYFLRLPRRVGKSDRFIEELEPLPLSVSKKWR